MLCTLLVDDNNWHTPTGVSICSLEQCMSCFRSGSKIYLWRVYRVTGSQWRVHCGLQDLLWWVHCDDFTVTWNWFGMSSRCDEFTVSPSNVNQKYSRSKNGLRRLELAVTSTNPDLISNPLPEPTLVSHLSAIHPGARVYWGTCLYMPHTNQPQGILSAYTHSIIINRVYTNM